MSMHRYDLRSAAPTPGRAALRYLTTAKFDREWNSYLHTHSCAELFYVTAGRGQFRIEDATRPVSAGDLVIINSYTMHTETSQNEEPLEYIVLGVDGLELTTGNRQVSQFYMTSAGREDILFYLREILREVEAAAPGYETICQDILEVLLVRLMRAPDFSVQLTAPEGQVSKESAIARRYIEHHFKENITLDILAEKTHINKYHLAHIYARDYAVSPISYLLSLRIQESRYLLSSTDLSLTQISHIIGFSSPSYFSQSFRRAEGISPTEFRLQARAENHENHRDETP